MCVYRKSEKEITKDAYDLLIPRVSPGVIHEHITRVGPGQPQCGNSRCIDKI